jgi:hypothetical protein
VRFEVIAMAAGEQKDFSKYISNNNNNNNNINNGTHTHAQTSV